MGENPKKIEELEEKIRKNVEAEVAGIFVFWTVLVAATSSAATAWFTNG